jgi:hypothetical protein
MITVRQIGYGVEMFADNETIREIGSSLNFSFGG